MLKIIYKKLFSSDIIQLQINFLFICFIFLSGLKYDYFQFRFLILVLLIPCFLRIIKDIIYRNFKNIYIFSFFLFILILHSSINILYENTSITKYNLFGILFLTCIFIISFYFFENFNKNIYVIVKLFLIIFFTSVLLSFFNYKNDAPFFCGGIPDVFGYLKSYEQYLPDGKLKALNNLDLDRIGDMKFSFKEYIFPENSHLGMIAPSVIIYLIYVNFTKKTSNFLKFATIVFIILCLIKSSTTLILGTILSLILLILFNYKNISKNLIISYVGIFLIFFTILISSKECRSRFVPTYLSTTSIEQSSEIKELETVGEVNSKFASNLKNLLGVGGNLSSGVYFHALMIAKKSILEKPFGWGLNRYDIAFEYFNSKNPSKIEILNSFNNKDGTNNFVKLIVEMGLFALLFYMFFFLFLINKKIPIEYKFFYLPLIITQSLRGAGYFNGGFSLIVFLMLFTYLRLIKKNI